MIREVKNGLPVVPPNLIDRIVAYFNPLEGIKRTRARTFSAMIGDTSYYGASKTRRSVSQWNPLLRDADGDTLRDLQTIRDRSRDLCRNAPLALGAINTKVLNIVGSGLRLQSRVDAEFLKLSPDEADAWQRKTEREFALWAGSPNCDASRCLDFYALQELAFRSMLESGDVFIAMPAIRRHGWPYMTSLQLIEADRVRNKNDMADTPTLAGGVEKTEYGEPVAYHVMTSHPGAFIANREWRRLEAFGAATGRRNVLHLFRRLRPDQTRGVPDLVPVMETLKQLDRYTEAEIMAAIVTGMFAVFFKSEGEGGLAPVEPTLESRGAASDRDFKLVSGMVGELGPGERLETVNPSRPNMQFDPFVMAILRQVGVALELPFEILIKHFTASYSASRAALLEAWRFFKARRRWMSANFCDPIYEVWMSEAVASGRIVAPGFFADSAIRAAYLRADWLGSSPGHIQPLQEAEAEQTWLEMGVKTLAEITAEATGGDWEQNHRQRAREVRMRRADGLEEELLPATAPVPGARPAPSPKPAKKSDRFKPE